jgi:hypothetical protein
MTASIDPGQFRNLLRDGTPALLRPVSPVDRDRIQGGWSSSFSIFSPLERIESTS